MPTPRGSPTSPEWTRAALTIVNPFRLRTPPTLADLFAAVHGTDDELILERLVTTSFADLLDEWFESDIELEPLEMRPFPDGRHIVLYRDEARNVEASGASRSTTPRRIRAGTRSGPGHPRGDDPDECRGPTGAGPRRAGKRR